MTKAGVVDMVQERVRCSKKEASEIVEDIFAMLRECLCRGEKVKISGFGCFVVNQKHARRGRDPQTGDTITITPRAVLSFRPSGVLKSRVLNGRSKP